ncbi:MAG: DUF924 domain-containing protein [Cyanothece sp. SIO2G6]|nr:DUF924 domain-containing protein [Cyanothece sp. SIO2G6]
MNTISASEQREQTAILNFWFGGPWEQEPSYTQQRKLWFRKSEQTDQLIRDQFSQIYRQIAAGSRQSWSTTAQGALAAVIVLDQFSRNMFRETPQAFATDAQALAVAEKAIAQGFDQQVFPAQRLFFYLPFEHSENKQHQQRSVMLFQTLTHQSEELKDTYDYALKHQIIIEQFGRFPHRNGILGRSSTPAEIAFLQQPGSSF